VEARNRLELGARRVDRGRHRRRATFRVGQAAVHLFDDRRVEALLGLERRCNQPPHEGAQPSLERAIDTRRGALQDVPALVQLTDQRSPIRRRLGRAEKRGCVERRVESSERLVVAAVRVEPLAIEPREQILEGLVGQAPKI
jgi:hypothetical protein